MIIGRAVPGVSLAHEPIPPSSIPVKPGYKYYALHTSGRWWETICKARRLALYLPDEFPDLKVEYYRIIAHGGAVGVSYKEIFRWHRQKHWILKPF
jgi:type VI secretion system protein ImpJ